MNLTTMILHYSEYSENLEQTRDRVLEFLEVPLLGEGMPFHTGKVYHDYYTLGQRRAISNFVREFATTKTWMELKDYDFDLDDSVASE